MKYFVIGLSLLALVGCKDYGNCLSSHSETYHYFTHIGKIPIMQTSHHSVCDEWQYPDGKNN